MNFKSLIIPLFFVPVLALAQGAGTDAIELPLTIHKGAGPFKKIAELTPMIAKGSEASDIPEGSYPQLSGISPRWGDDYASGVIIFDQAQYYYQLYTAGKISEDVMASKLAALDVDQAMLSKEPIKCYTSFAYRYNPSGCVVVIDRNNNLDMSDDGTMNILRPSYMIDTEDEINLSAEPNYSVWVNYQHMQDNKLVNDSLPLAMFLPDEGDDLLYSIGIYATAKLNDTQIGVAQKKLSSADFTDVVVTPDFVASKPVSDKLFTEGQLFQTGGEDYKVLKVDYHKGTLRLVKVTK